MPSSGSGDCHRFNLIDLPVARLGLRIVRTDVANTSLKIATLTQHFRELSHSRRYPIQTSGFSTREHDMNSCHDIANDRRYCFGFDPSIPAYTELFDCAASIMTHAQHQPPLLVGAVAYDLFSKSNGTTFRQTKVGFIAINRILHPYFTDSSVTTDFLLKAVTCEMKQCQLKNQVSIDIVDLSANKNQLSSPFSLFIDKFSEARSWNPIQQPLPLTPNISSETLLTTLLKLYAIRVDVTLFFKRLWTPVLPSIISTISMPVVDCSSAFKSLIKVATRLLSHTFSETSMVLLPVTATAVSQALYALIGIEGLRTYLFDLLILPNLVKILSLADDDCAGADVLHQCNACYDRSNWWPEHKNEVFNPVRSLVWIVWRLYSGAVGITGQALSTVSTECFFCDDTSIDSSSMSDQRLQNLLFTISRSVARSIELIVRLPLDVNKCRSFETMRSANSEESEVFAALSTANALNRRLSIVTPKPAEMLQLLVISRYEVSAFFDAVIGSLNAEVTRGEKVIASEESTIFLRERITRYKILENMIQRTVPLASQRVSEQMMLKLYNVHHSDNGGVDDQDIKTAHHQLLNGIELANSYEAVLLDRLHCLQGKTKNKSKLCDQLGPHYISAASCPSDISAHNTCTSTSDNYQCLVRNTFSDILTRKGKQSTRSAELSQATTESFVLKIIPPHRGVIHAVRPLERAQECQAECKSSALCTIFLYYITITSWHHFIFILFVICSAYFRRGYG